MKCSKPAVSKGSYCRSSSVLQRGLFSPPRLIRIIKLYHAQVYEFGYYRAKFAFPREGALDVWNTDLRTYFIETLSP
ncbi:MAG: hypothetical protein DMG97_38010 [Acidobacteria bacterium]|nr:MAG: hypothetical protein DMG97_38010 [Acidobacteriota bacterium]